MVAKEIIFLLLVTMVVTPYLGNAEVAIPDAAPVLEPHQICSSDNECILMQRKCSDCDCGTPINLKYHEIYREEKKKRCENYKGPVCDLMCPTNTSVCRAGKCTTK